MTQALQELNTILTRQQMERNPEEPYFKIVEKISTTVEKLLEDTQKPFEAVNYDGDGENSKEADMAGWSHLKKRKAHLQTTISKYITINNK